MANPSAQVDYKLKQKALKYVLIDDDMFRRSQEGVFLKCLNKDEALKVIGELHEGMCGAHKFGSNMKWLISQYRYYWPTIIADYIAYAEGCEAYQLHGPIQRVPAEELHAIIKTLAI